MLTKHLFSDPVLIRCEQGIVWTSRFIDRFCVESLFPVAEKRRAQRRKKKAVEYTTLFLRLFCLQNDVDSVRCSRPKLPFFYRLHFHSLVLPPHLDSLRRLF